MKKFFEKHDLIKISGIMLLLTALLTWIIPYGYFSGSEMVTQDITRVGVTNFMQYGLLGIYYFTVLVTFLFVLGGFYELIGKAQGYQAFVKKISDALKGKEKIVVLCTMFLFAGLNSILNEFFPLIVFIPLVVTILSRLKLDKLTSLRNLFSLSGSW